jgi:hypothetical protein
VTLPVGIDGNIEDVLADFGEGYDVRLSTSRSLRATSGRVPVRYAVYCPARDGSLPVVEVARVGSGRLSASSASGTANAWVSVATP